MIYCEKCNCELPDGSLFCGKCGAKQGEKQTKKRLIVISVMVAAVIVAIGIGVTVYFLQPSKQYEVAEKAFSSQNFKRAMKAYERAGDYRDAPEKFLEASRAYYYNEGLASLDNGDYERAIDDFMQAEGYEDSHKLACDIGIKIVEDGDYETAKTIFTDIKEREYAAYCDGMLAMGEEDYQTEKTSFKTAIKVFDAAEKYQEAGYLYATELFNSRKYDRAITAFNDVSEYKDAESYLYYSSMLYAKQEMTYGDLNNAKRLLDSVPADSTYDDVAALDLLAKLEENSSWMNLCGKWQLTSGQMRSTQDGSYNDWWWYRDFKEGDYELDVWCGLRTDGTVTVKIVGTIPIYTNYSSFKEYLETDTYKINVNENVTTMGTINIDKYASITLSDSKVTFNYNKTENNKDVYFDYIYKTDATYGKRTVAY